MSSTLRTPPDMRARHGGMVPAAPLLEAIRRTTRPGSLSPADERAFYRAAASGVITRDMADRLAVGVLGVHPASVLGPVWWSQ